MGERQVENWMSSIKSFQFLQQLDRRNPSLQVMSERVIQKCKLKDKNSHIKSVAGAGIRL